MILSFECQITYLNIIENSIISVQIWMKYVGMNRVRQFFFISSKQNWMSIFCGHYLHWMSFHTIWNSYNEQTYFFYVQVFFSFWKLFRKFNFEEYETRYQFKLRYKLAYKSTNTLIAIHQSYFSSVQSTVIR